MNLEFAIKLARMVLNGEYVPTHDREKAYSILADFHTNVRGNSIIIEAKETIRWTMQP